MTIKRIAFPGRGGGGYVAFVSARLSLNTQKEQSLDSFNTEA